MSGTFFHSRHERLQAEAHRLLLPLDSARPLEDEALKKTAQALPFYAYLVPKAYGGVTEQVELLSLCALREELAYRNPALDALFAVQGLGSHVLFAGGCAEQKSTLLPQVATGEVLLAFALTEPEAGSDAASLRSTAVPQPDGSYLLSGQKRFVTNAGLASHYVVFARAPLGISAFVVPSDTPGLTWQKQELLSDHPIGELRFERSPLLSTQRIGGEGEGLRLALGALEIFRITVAAAAVGLAKRALDEAVAYCKTRHQFGAPLAEIPAIQSLLADSAVEWEAARLLTHRAAALKDSGAVRVGFESATAKLYATEAAQRIVDRCLQAHGGNGLIRNSTMERLYRDVRGLRIYEGASEVQRWLIARHLLDLGGKHLPRHDD